MQYYGIQTSKEVFNRTKDCCNWTKARDRLSLREDRGDIPQKNTEF